MKNIYALLYLWLLPFTGIAQTTDSGIQTINAADFPVALYSGIPEISIPLATLPTANKDFNVNLDLQYNLYASTSNYFSVRQIGDAWSLDFLGSISITQGKQQMGGVGSPYITDEEYYRNIFGIVPTTPVVEGICTYNYNVFGLNGKFTIDKHGNAFKVKIIEQNDYADIQLNYSSSQFDDNMYDFRLLSFTITDKNGFQYFFENADAVVKKFTYPSNTTVLVKTLFHLSRVIDPNNVPLLTYTYSGTDPQNPVNNQAVNREFASLLLHKTGTLELSSPNASMRTLTVKNLREERVHTFEFRFQQYNSPKLLLTNVRMFNKDLTASNEYKIRYKYYAEALNDSDVFGFSVKGCNPDYRLKEDLIFDNRAIEKIISPSGGCTYYEFEPNTAGWGVKSTFESLNPGGGLYEATLYNIRRMNPENYTYEEIPLIYNPAYNGYLVDLTPYVPYTNAYDQFLYVDYKANTVVTDPGGLTDPNGNVSSGQSHLPTLKVSRYATIPIWGAPTTIPMNTCFPGYRLSKLESTTKFFLEIEPQYQSSYSYIKARYQKFKETAALKYYRYTAGPRIKTIKNFAQEVNSINQQEFLAHEVRYRYDEFGKSNTSSGFSRYTDFDNPNANQEQLRLHNYTDLTLYKNVTVETQGIGKIEYEFEKIDPSQAAVASVLPENAFINKLTKSIKKYNTSGALTEEMRIDREYKAYVYEPNRKISRQPIVYKENNYSVVHNPGVSNGKIATITTSVYDTITRNLSSRQITDLQQGEHFEERYSYEKYHKTYRAKEVLKYKNGDLLNRSAFTYTPENGNPQLYQLRKSEVAKDDRPLETEQEITLYDAYGNVLEYRTKEGLYVSQIWGYHDTKIVCELKNIRYQDIDAGIIAGIHYQTNLTDNSYNENYIRTQYQILRQAHPQSMVTSYTYRPMIGMSSLTDTNGRTEYYEYDKFNRLSVVKDHDGNRLKAYEYHYKN